ncbi:MAG: rhomboid family intramembrane serine protease [Actinomycetota bacterium]
MADPGSLPPPPAAYTPEHCFRHPSEQTGVHCTRCNRPICPDCMIPAPVGYQCPECVGRSKRELSKGTGRRAVVVGARRTTASVTNILIAINVAVFALEVIVGGPDSLLTGPTGPQLARLGSSIVYFTTSSGGAGGVVVGEYWRLLTSMFLHEGIIHIGLNMYGLWLFGRVLEDELGSMKTLAVYLVSGLAGGAFSYAFGSIAGGVGASGAIYGLLGAFVAYNYRRRDMRFYRARLQAVMPWVFLNLFLSFRISFIDWRAHVGGMAAGAIALYIVEAKGEARTRKAVMIAGLAALLAGTVALTVYGTSHWKGVLEPITGPL